MNNTKDYIRIYARARPLFLSVLRGKEVALYQRLLPLKHPVLDVGCGDGFFARTTFGKGRIDVGLDMEGSRISESRTSGAYKKIVTYDGYTIPFPDRSFQTVVINSVLEHVDDVPRVMSEIRRVLRPGGMCVATVMAAPWERYLFGTKLFGDGYRRWMKRKQVHKQLLSASEWVAAWKKAGLKPITTIPYLSRRAGTLLDILHYVSLPSLLTYKVWKTWVLWQSGVDLYPLSSLATLMDEEVSLEDAGALFFVLKRM